MQCHGHSPLRDRSRRPTSRALVRSAKLSHSAPPQIALDLQTALSCATDAASCRADRASVRDAQSPVFSQTISHRVSRRPSAHRAHRASFEERHRCPSFDGPSSPRLHSPPSSRRRRGLRREALSSRAARASRERGHRPAGGHSCSRIRRRIAEDRRVRRDQHVTEMDRHSCRVVPQSSGSVSSRMSTQPRLSSFEINPSVCQGLSSRRGPSSRREAFHCTASNDSSASLTLRRDV